MKNNSESRNAPADHRGGNAPLPFEKNTKKPAGAWDPSLEAGANQKTSEYVDQQPDTADTTDMFSLLVEDQLGNSTEVPPDGKFHRFDDPEKRSGNRNCFAMLNEEGTYGVYGNWGTGEKYHWFGESNTEMSSDELAEIHQRIEATYQDRADQRAEDHDAAAEEARSLIAKSSNPRPDYPYLKRKNIGVANSRQYGERLLIPMENVDGELRNTQQIHPDGSKRFQKGGEV